MKCYNHPPLRGTRHYFSFVEERHMIYRKRRAGEPWPWTEDEILQKYKFTNVYRELDRGTIWLRENIREPYTDHPELFFNIAIYRIYNRIGTAEVIGFIEDYPTSNTEQKVRDYQEQGGTVFTGAYMLTGKLPGKDKIEQYFGNVFKILWERRRELEPKEGDTLQQAFNRIADSGVPGIGDFLAYEIVTDLRWTRYLENASDIMTWANPGPGAKRGIRRIYGLPARIYRIDDKDLREELRSMYPHGDEGCIWVMQRLLALANNSEMEVLPLSFPKMEMRDIEHSLCEYDKYMRVRLGEGTPRSRFVPPHKR